MEAIELGREIGKLPHNLQSEVLAFIELLKAKQENLSKKKQREFGIGKGKIKISEDFDAPLEDFKDYM
ncbi:type II toxin-antitoxin system VapB family antitoxin [Lacihabitans soyangensis]|jgi:hypothetical protein|uniref:DUF2281 domain-containing protein n=1 Tax=Lacihabitans soyangensis TaxID=869394 RepID=A0AAE3KXW4_9BACT|nr:DUF2281 domain-containing protein [Lacihabitans soyangensis]MCP9765970.1 DUF2281 domain-containing protein [Lacihabitans soyangensis]